ncbi:four-carbon acid sugar kinase family protein [Kiloniella antarctica]|uniref:Four-carbon acid sugar kinase family protein n=1 Tax=Kiloniella antarctica TaxID=1550907 RepID=A0ABW5BKG9_9PROT
MKKNELTLNSQVPMVGILADDFTSAADAAGPFVARGYEAIVRRGNIRAEGQLMHSLHEDIYAIDVGSRLLSASEAAQLMASAASKLLASKLLLKTIDSTLRGNIRSELKSTIEIAFTSGEYDRVVIAPAFPNAGRVTRRGVQYIDGIPVSQSSYGRDIVHPATTSSIQDLLDPCFGKPVIVSHQADIAELNNDQNNAQILILDAESQRELSRLIARISNPERVLWVGSPGLAIALSDLLSEIVQPTKPQSKSEPKIWNIATAFNRKRVLILIGSANKVSHDQSAHLLNSGVPVFERAMEILSPKFSKSPIVCLTVPPTRQSNSQKVKEALITEALTLMSLGEFDTVIATGGETMVAFMETLFLDKMLLKGELEPGFPYGIARSKICGHDKTAPDFLLAMKAGGFGAPGLLLDAARSFLSISTEKTNAN